MSAGNARRRALLIQRLAASHCGQARGIRARDLARVLGLRERVLRQLVSDAREDGVAIAGTPESGYFIAETAAELEACCHFLRARALHSLHIEAQLRRIPLADLLGQLRLPT
ncbi:hypothetical protein ACG04Q_11920 [Roseateles sp. DXS20W]|uniref:HTH domain-containing protein n=1 Tax=Pelomonas lactea TaxID=3299030 RepID=A0ABW7GK21_9BURK